MILKPSNQKVFTIKVGKFLRKSQKVAGFILWETLVSLVAVAIIMTSFLLLYSKAVVWERHLILKLDALAVALQVINTVPLSITSDNDQFEIVIEQQPYSLHFKTILVQVFDRVTKQKLVQLGTGYYVP